MFVNWNERYYMREKIYIQRPLLNFSCCSNCIRNTYLNDAGKFLMQPFKQSCYRHSEEKYSPSDTKRWATLSSLSATPDELLQTDNRQHMCGRADLLFFLFNSSR